jgi:hypothetical protein
MYCTMIHCIAYKEDFFIANCEAAYVSKLTEKRHYILWGFWWLKRDIILKFEPMILWMWLLSLLWNYVEVWFDDDFWDLEHVYRNVKWVILIDYFNELRFHGHWKWYEKYDLLRST